MGVSPRLLRVSPRIRSTLGGGGPIITLRSAVVSRKVPFPRGTRATVRMRRAVHGRNTMPTAVTVVNNIVGINLDGRRVRLLNHRKRGIAGIDHHSLPFIITTKGGNTAAITSAVVVTTLTKVGMFTAKKVNNIRHKTRRAFSVSTSLRRLTGAGIAIIYTKTGSVLSLKLAARCLRAFNIPLVNCRAGTLPTFFYHADSFSIDVHLSDTDRVTHTVTIG